MMQAFVSLVCLLLGVMCGKFLLIIHATSLASLARVFCGPHLLR